MNDPHAFKTVRWIGSSLKDLRSFPDDVKRTIGYGLYRAQLGFKATSAKPLVGFGSAGVVEIVDDHKSGTYRAVYPVRFSQLVYVLHVFQKKSKHGIATPRSELDLIQKRLKLAEEDYKNISNEDVR
jgi:phage-related protein